MEKTKIEKQELTPTRILELKVNRLEGDIKVWKYKCEQLEQQLLAKNAAFGDLMDDDDFEEIL